MSILLGILLYALCVAWICGLTGLNRLDDAGPRVRRARELARGAPTVPATQVAAPEAHL